MPVSNRGANRAWRCRAGTTDEHQTHHDGQHAANTLQHNLIGDQRGGHPEHRDGAEQEDRREARDEQQRRPGDPQAGLPMHLHRAGLFLHADDPARYDR
jgi:hypothetical protein